MRIQRIERPKSIDERRIAQSLSNGANTVVLQFPDDSDYEPRLLEEVNSACKLFGAKLNVRFYGHHSSKFDCGWLRYLPDVRSLNLDCLTSVSNAHEIERLEHLEEFAFGVFESDLPDLLRFSSLLGIRRLILAESRKNNIDLAPLAQYERLQVLFLNSHTRNIDALGRLNGIKKLLLGSMPKKQPLNFVGAMSGLLSLTLILGGRESLHTLAHPGVRHLEILRVRGVTEFDLSLFPQLEKLYVEDQLHFKRLELEPATLLRRLSIWNCKNFRELGGLSCASHLEYLFVGKTSIYPEVVLSTAPKSLKYLNFTGYAKRKADELKARIESLGYSLASYNREPPGTSEIPD
jgi:protein phosphatase 1 regulatory subunit 7